VEPTLKALYSIQRIPCEFIIIDDASTDGTTEAIRSLIEYYQHDQTYFFEQEAPCGRGNSLNNALEQIRGRILWMPENLNSVDQDWLGESVETLIAANAHTAVAMEDPVPKSPMDWLHLLQNERIPYDRNYLFNLGRMRSIRKFIDPHWSTRHATELAIRLMADSDPIQAKQFARGETRRMEMDDRSKKECVLAMLRIPELSLSGQEKAFRMLRSFGHTDTEEDEGSAEPLYQEAQTLYKSGNSVAALELLNRILAAEPDHRRARLFKIQILEKMRRYVEAAELKHGYNVGKTAEEPERVDADAADETESERVDTDAADETEPELPDEDVPDTAEEVPETSEGAPETPKTDITGEKVPEETVEELQREGAFPDDSEETEKDISSVISFEDEPEKREADSDHRKESAASRDEEKDEADRDRTHDAGEEDKKDDDDDFFIDLSDTETRTSETPEEEPDETESESIQQKDEPVQKDREPIDPDSESIQLDEEPVHPEGESAESEVEKKIPDGADDKSVSEDDKRAGAPDMAAGTKEDEQVKPSSAFGDEIRRQPQLTVIIPTATVQRPVLEDCLTSVFRQSSTERTRIIVIDNGSVDDTASYLRNLIKEHPQLTVLRNEQNIGFAGAVNQGLTKAGDGFIVVMHNDVMLRNPVPARLALKLEKNPDIGLIVPRTEQNTWNPAQRDDHTNDRPFTDTAIVDGYMMVFRNQPGLAMSREYGLAFFDDTDFCYRMQRKGFRIAIDNREQVVHLGGKTTGDLGLARFTKGYWRNSAIFHKEWDTAPRFPSDQARTDPLRQFVVLGGLINPFYPEEHLLGHFNTLFTSEQKTRVMNTEYPPDALKAMLRLMMATNQRDVLRKLEEQLDPLPPDRQLYYDLITFYFDRTIYSRCKRYLEKLSGSDLPVALELYHLKIALGEKDYEAAAELLTDMIGRYPTHPEVLITAAEIHRKNGNREQSEKFTALARTFDPSARSSKP